MNPVTDILNPIRPLNATSSNFWSPSSIQKRLFGARCSVIVTPKPRFEFYTSAADGRAPARRGCVITNWSAEFKTHVYHVIGLTPTGKYAVITMSEINSQQLFVELHNDWKDAKASVQRFYK